MSKSKKILKQSLHSKLQVTVVVEFAQETKFECAKELKFQLNMADEGMSFFYTFYKKIINIGEMA